MTDPAKVTIRVLVIHDRALIREGLCAILARDPEIVVVGAAAKIGDVISIAEREKPDLILIDVDREGKEDGLELLATLHQTTRHTPKLILAGLVDNVKEIMSGALSLGASGVVLKQQGPEVLIKAIKKVHEGEVWFDRMTIGRLLRERINPLPTSLDPAVSRVSSVTPREHEVISLIAEGLKNKQIAERLFISETTVTHHLSSIYSKLGVSDRLELVLYALSHNILSK